MTEETAPAAAEPIADNPTPNPAETGSPVQKDEVTQGQPPSGEKRRELDEIMRAASEKARKAAEAKEPKAEKPEPKADKEPTKAEPKAEKAEPKADKPEAKAEKPEAKSAPERGPDGKFTSKEGQEPAKDEAPATQTQRAPHHEAPSRFSPDAKSEWEAAPESIKAETHRALREMEQGIQKYRGEAEKFNEIRDFAEQFEQAGKSTRQVVEQYVGLDKALSSMDPREKMGALQEVFQYAGINPREWAARIMNQTPEQAQVEQEQTIQSLRKELTDIKSQLGQVSQGFQQQQQSQVAEKVSSFAADRPRFEELAEDIAFFLQSGKVPQNLPPQERLSQAYELAERLNPAPYTAPQSAPAPPPEPLNPAGSKSVAGAPASGSDPVLPAKRTGKPPSIQDAMKRARARLAS